MTARDAINSYFHKSLLILSTLVSLIALSATAVAQPNTAALSDVCHVLEKLDRQPSIGKKAGIPEKFNVRFSQIAHDKGFYIFVRARNEALSFISSFQRPTRPKPLWMKLKTARKGEHLGLVQVPTPERFSNPEQLTNATKIWAEDWTRIQKEYELHLDAEGVVVDNEGRAFEADIDLLAVYKAGGEQELLSDRSGFHPYEDNELAELNHLLTPERVDPTYWFLQHGSHSEWRDKYSMDPFPAIVYEPSGGIQWLYSWKEFNEYLGRVFTSIR
jgi:hypothetical protein